MHRRVVWLASCVRHSLTARASLARVTNLSYHKTRYWNRKFTGRRVYKNSATTRVIKARVRDRPSTDLQARFREGTTPISAVADAAIVALDLPRRRTRWGDAVTRITSGAAAVDAADTFHPRLVLLDVHLPGAMDGSGRGLHWGAAAHADHRSVRPCRSPRRREVPAPVFTLAKPVSGATLQETLRRALAVWLDVPRP
jgi:CheY-like chemotaxis protein